jgi:cell division protease FtsH
MDRKKLFRSWWPWALIIAVLFALFILPSVAGSSSYSSVNTSDAVNQINSGNVSKATLHDKEQTLDLDLKTPDGGHSKISTSYPNDATSTIFNALESSKTNFTTKVTRGSLWVSLLETFFPFILIGLVLFFVMSQVQGGGSRVMSFGRSKAKLVSKDTPKTTFADVAGADEAVEELLEIKEFLANPAKFQAIGAKIPKGVLLYGPPGTGKTLLARAVAGEAGVPFYAISGSDFVEMFVGVGASRVRDLFEQAKTNAPAIVFVDEIDAVGRHRGAGMGGGHDEREQTLNQLLVEMDGFDVKGGVILIAATNRPDILDPALLRPGRFDRQIAVGPPDVLGREAVLRVHAKGKPFAQDVDLGVIARRTPGFTGADLANVINEAALLTARNNGRLITTASLEESIDRVIAGPERKTRAMSDKEKRVTAYHEAGHALTAWAMPNLDPVHKVTILPRGRSLGHTLVLPLEDRYTQSRSEILDQLVYALGGRAAEELVFHEPTTGASNDIEKASALARSMVTEYGMSSKLGAVKYGTSDSEPFMGRDYGHQRDYSEDVAADIDAEVRNLIEGAHDEAWEILVQYRDVLDAMVLELAEKETLAKDDLERILAPVRKRPPHNSFSGFGKRTPSDRPPIEIPPSQRRAAANAAANGAYANGANGANGAGWNQTAPAGAQYAPTQATQAGPNTPPPPYGQSPFGQSPTAGAPGTPSYGQPAYGNTGNIPFGTQPQPGYGQPDETPGANGYGQPAGPSAATPADGFSTPQYNQPYESGSASNGTSFPPPPEYPTYPERPQHDPDGGPRDES